MRRTARSNPEAYALQEINEKLNKIEKEIDNINNSISLKCSGVDPCSCCGMATCCCFLVTCIACSPCIVGSAVLNFLTCGYLEAQKKEKIDAIKPDENEIYAINQLKSSLTSLSQQNSQTFLSGNKAVQTINLINNILNTPAINKLRPFLETLKVSIANENGIILLETKPVETREITLHNLLTTS